MILKKRGNAYYIFFMVGIVALVAIVGIVVQFKGTSGNSSITGYISAEMVPHRLTCQLVDAWDLSTTVPERFPAYREFQPYAIDVDNENNVYVRGLNIYEPNILIKVFNAEGTLIREINYSYVEGRMLPLMTNPTGGIALDTNNNIYLGIGIMSANRSDGRNGPYFPTILKLNAYGEYRATLVVEEVPFNVFPSDNLEHIDIGDNNEIYVSLWRNRSVMKLTSEGEYITSLKMSPTFDQSPVGIAFNQNNNALYVNTNWHDVVRFDEYENMMNLSCYTDHGVLGNMEIDPSGNIYIADTPLGKIPIVNPNGTFMSRITASDTPDNFIAPSDIAIDRQGNLYVADMRVSTNLGNPPLEHHARILKYSCSPVLPSPEPLSLCNDTDEGNNIFAKGSVESFFECSREQQGPSEDYCTEAFDGTPMSEGSFITEWTCENGKLINYSKQCPSQYTCKEGRCVVSQCRDSDGGRNEYIPGYTQGVSADEDERLRTKTDYCIQKNEEGILRVDESQRDPYSIGAVVQCNQDCAVHEYYCSNVTIASEIIDCVQCIQGACVSSRQLPPEEMMVQVPALNISTNFTDGSTSFCRDEDGDQPEIGSYITSRSSGTTERYDDECITVDYLWEYTCSDGRWQNECYKCTVCDQGKCLYGYKPDHPQVCEREEELRG